MTTKIPMTVIGAEKLREELDHLKRVDRQNVIQAIAEARAHGDLKENAEYHAAKEQQSFIETRILELEGKLSNAQIIDVSKMRNTGRVIFGTKVDLINIDTDEKITYHIVGDDEANIKEGKISVSSPLARALIAKEEGDIIDLDTPTGTTSYEIEKVHYQ